MSLDLRLVAYAPNGASLGPLPAPTDWAAGFPLGDVGALTLTYGKAAPRADLLGQPVEIAVEASHDGGPFAEVPDGRFLYLRDESDPLRLGADTLSAECPSYLWRFSKAYVGTTALANDGKRRFQAATAGTILKTLINAAQARGALAGITHGSWSTTQDSAGNAWTKFVTIAYDPTVSLLTVLLNLMDQGMIDVRMNGRDLEVHAWNSLDVDRTLANPAVILRAGHDLTEAPTRRTWEGIANRVLFVGDEGVTLTRSNPTAISPWGDWESSISHGGLKDTGTMATLSDYELQRSENVRSEQTSGLQFTSARFLPFRDYLTGDFLFRDVNGTQERLRVRSLVVGRNSQGETVGNVVLNDRFLEREVRLARRTQGILGGAGEAGGAGTVPVRQLDLGVPAAPTGVTATSAAYLDSKALVRAQVTVSWAPVTTNTDGTAADDLAEYEVHYQIVADGVPLYLTQTDAATTSASGSGLPPATAIEVRVRARDRDGRAGPWSGWVGLTTDNDVTPPPAPSTPVVAAFLGQARITWDGLTSTGTAQPDDFARTEVHVSDVTGFTPSASTLKTTLRGAGEFIVTGLPKYVPAYVRLIAVDLSGNKSAPSAQASVTPLPVVATDLDERTANQIMQTWTDTFEDPTLGWTKVAGNETNPANLRLVSSGFSNNGSGQVLQAVGGSSWIIPDGPPIPFDPLMLYRTRARVMRITTSDVNGRVYVGLVGLAADGVTPIAVSGVQGSYGNSHYHAAVNATLTTPNVWVDYEGYTQGHGSTTGTGSPAPNPQLPGTMHPDVRFVKPLIILNYDLAAGAAGDTRIERVDVEIIRNPANIIGRAQINDLAVNSAKIEDLAVGKLLAGELTATWVRVVGRLTTAAGGVQTGARVEMDSAGLRAYNSSGALRVNIQNTGDALLIGTLQTNVTGQPGIKLSAFTGGVNGIVWDRSSPTSANAAIIYCNPLTVNSHPAQEMILQSSDNSATNTQRSYLQLHPDYVILTAPSTTSAGVQTRFEIDDNDLLWTHRLGAGGDGNVWAHLEVAAGPRNDWVCSFSGYRTGYAEFRDNRLANTSLSVALDLFTEAGFGVALRADATGTLALNVANWDENTFVAVKASAFTVSSDARHKRAVAALDKRRARTLTNALAPRTYDRVYTLNRSMRQDPRPPAPVNPGEDWDSARDRVLPPPRDPRPDLPVSREVLVPEIGLVADEIAASTALDDDTKRRLLSDDADSPLGRTLNLYGLVSLLLGAVQDLSDDLAELRGQTGRSRAPVLPGGGGPNLRVT